MFTSAWNSCCSVAKLCLTLQPYGLQHARLSYPSLSPRICSNSCPLCQWCHPTISPSITLFSSCLQSFPAPGSFPMSQLFPSGGQSIGATVSALSPSNEYSGLISFWMTVLISLQSKELWRVFSKATVLKYQFFSAQSSLWSSSQNHTWLQKNPHFDCTVLCWQSDVSAF